MYRYREIAPNSACAETIECFWTLEVLEDFQHLVVPDGCVDIILFWRGDTLEAAMVIGTMTKPRRVSLSAGQVLCGIRFHPGMFSAYIKASLPRLTDQEVALDAIASRFPCHITHALQTVTSSHDCFIRLEEALSLKNNIRSSHLAVQNMYLGTYDHNQSDGIQKAFLSDRQFRRVCFRETGVAPKRLQRIIRFRRVWITIHENPRNNIGELAIDCGYSDQAHLIREFREFAGVTPGSYVKSLL